MSQQEYEFMKNVEYSTYDAGPYFIGVMASVGLVNGTSIYERGKTSPGLHVEKLECLGLVFDKLVNPPKP